jgi:hypothetical protein
MLPVLLYYPENVYDTDKRKPIGIERAKKKKAY